MSDFSFLAVPNIEGMRLGWYIQIFGIVIFFGVCLYFVLYFLLIHRRKQKLLRQFSHFDQQAHDLSKQLLVDKIRKSSGKTKLILFIEYLEKFVTTKATGAGSVQAYANLSELLLSHGFTAKEAEECEHVLYANKELSQQLEIRIDQNCQK